MRKIKFRVWDEDEQKMKEVNSIHFPIGKSSGKDVTVYNKEEEYYDWVYSYELMQYTGLKDKNGKEIYEGDIIEINNETRWEVIFNDGSFKIESIEHPVKDSFSLEQEMCNLLEVVGNKYEYEWNY